MFETINERIKHILDTLYKGNTTAMAKATNVKRTTLGSIVGTDGNSPGFDVIMKIAGIPSPRISMEWLIRGVGEMFIDEKDAIKYSVNTVNSHNENANINDTDTINRLLSMLEAKDKQMGAKESQVNTLLEIIKNIKVG
ncbi:hypothetical protein [uncultured Prevotella sp.]|uniref:hypothetical protein n=1 Tax=uncultured Prevotella sp. TaxID=159272 RepID=UPI00260C3C14|nr:hypothetical protein [uncultured Prevotella sp.]